LPNLSLTPSRRAILKGLSGLALTTAATTFLPQAPALAHSLDGSPRNLAFVNAHTGDEIDIVYWAEGRYQPSALKQLDFVMRDWRSGEVAPIDSKLFDLLHALRKDMDSDAPFSIISGYRSPATNARLREKSNGVARRSLHMKGMAIDVSLPGRRLSSLRRMAMDQRAGGVGYYPKSGFLHIDTGRVRNWG
jgi:uncharacterized protein YcbK (DUF882 family)